jgi:predicted nucleic acid-binding protein
LKTVLLDLNVVLDVILDRSPGVIAAARLWAAIEQGAGQGRLPAHGITTIFYLLAKAKGVKFARQGIERLISVFGVARVDEGVIRKALVYGWPDFEDAVCAAAAVAGNCDAIVSQDPAGYPDSPLPVLDPATALTWLQAK